MGNKTRRSFLAQDSDQEDLEVRRMKGSLLFDSKGKKYIDFFSSWNVGNFGWDNEEIKTGIRDVSKTDYIYPYFNYNRWEVLAQLLADLSPGKLMKSYRATGGTEAVDGAMQLSMVYTGRSKFMSIEDSYHGNSIGTLSIGSSSNRKKYKNLLPHCLKLDPPLDKKAASKVETQLKHKDVAAFIMEPVICNLGVLIPDQVFMEQLREICSRYGTLLIFDEVATGFGRTGRLFASEHFGVEPDIMCVAKAITGGNAGMGAIITTAEIADAVKDEFSLYSTYGWHPQSVEVAIATLTWLKRNKNTLLEKANTMGRLFAQRLAAMKFKREVEIRILGLAIGVDTHDNKYAERIKEKCRNKGLLLETEDSSLTMFPPLTIEKSLIEEGLDVLEQCI